MDCQSARSNNLHSLRNVMFRAAELSEIQYVSPEKMPGFKSDRVDIRTLSQKEQEEAAKAKKPVATHRFRLHFDTATDCKKGYDLLASLHLEPRIPVARYKTGQVRGFPFTATNKEIEQHLQQHACSIRMGLRHWSSHVSCNL